MKQQNPVAASSPDFNSYFDVEALHPSFRDVVARRRSAIRPMAGITNYDANYMKVSAFKRWGLSAYEDCWTFEMESRPIPFVSTDPRPLRVLDKFSKYIEPLLQVIVPRMEPHTQTYNKISKVGYPINANPEDDAGNLIKMDVLKSLFAPLREGDASGYSDSFSTIGIRT